MCYTCRPPGSPDGPIGGGKAPTGAILRTTAAIALVILAAAFTGATGPVQAEVQGDFLVFPALQLNDDSGTEPQGYAASDNVHPSLDLFATASSGGLRFLGEWFLTEDSQEIQRLQLGWHFATDDTVWLGRFHTPIGYWNTAYHHGTYLQTSTSRPAIIEFEGGHGPLPTHFTGLLWEGAAELDRGALHYALGFGLGPALNGKLDPVDLADPEDDHESGVIANLSWRPAAHGSNMIGVFAGQTEIPDHRAAFDHTDQTLAGLYANWQWEKLRLLGAWFRVENSFSGVRAPDEDFSAAYLQGEYSLTDRLTPYARIESSFGEREDSLFLGRLRGFDKRRLLGGLRFDITTRQALTVEIARREDFNAKSNRVVLQWSAYFP